ncbi:ATP-binding protein [Denitrificimonas sp. JX-1]|uniref:histidine kinase n=1 Tax=Denitrificimonas halotolerans TaxID=3098930 RepID=A0ABU5GMI1_9GAMM|nr:ATP-binding protein [Denitrificimonas sp. JX-1]MDY7218081.1 ATP-binding protein [Denitrificimonas sp. JX-1]
MVTRATLWGLLLYLCFAVTSVTAASVDVGQTSQWKQQLYQQTLFYKDDSQHMSVQQVAALTDGDAGFVYIDELSQPAQLSPAAWWTKISLTNSSELTYSLRLILNPGSYFHSVNFYTQRDGQWIPFTHTLDGTTINEPTAERLHWAGVNLAPGQNKTLLIRTTGVAPNKLAPYLYSEDVFNEYIARNAIWDGLLLGGLLALGWTSLLIAIFARSRVFIVLGLLSWLTLLVEGGRRGYEKLDFITHLIEFSYRSPLVLSNLTLMLFVVFILELARSEKVQLSLRKLWVGWAMYYAGLALISAFGDVYQVYWLADVHRPLFSLTLLVTAVLFLRQNAPTRGLIVAIAAFSLARASLIALESSGLLPDSIANLSMGSLRMNPILVLGGFLINLALFAGWIAHVGLQRRKALEKISRLQREENIRLTQEVARQTKALNEALQYADEKNRQQTQIVGYISHDLRAPLATIAGYTKLMESNASEQQKIKLNAITRSVDYQLALIEDILGYASAELKPLSLSPKATDLLEYLDEITQHATALSRQQNNSFYITVTQQIPKTVYLDGRRLRQVLLNLLSNAAKFTRNGEINLDLTATQLDSQWRLRFSISDSGIGIDPEQQAKIFQEFGQLEAGENNINAGLGLGLYIAQSILQSMGSKLSLDSCPNQGATFSFEFNVLADEQLVSWQPPQTLPTLDAIDLPLSHNVEVPVQTQDMTANKTILSDNLSKPPVDKRQELVQLARNGALTDIEHWYSNMSAQYPECIDYLNLIQEAINRLDFHKVERLALDQLTLNQNQHIERAYYL